MRKGFVLGLSVIINILFVSLCAQNDISVLSKDSTHRYSASPLLEGDTLTNAEIDRLNKNGELKIVEDFHPNPSKAVLYSAIFPGLGQIYNRKYWKLPIVYGGFLGVVYAVTWNGNMYTDYKNGYTDIMIDPANRTRWHSFISSSESVDDILNDITKLEERRSFLKRRRDYFRRNRDLAIIVGVGLYALCMIDAYVDAQLYNFSITPDLSMTVAPVVWGPSQLSSSATVGFQCSIVF